MGFSSPDFLKHLGPGVKTLTSEALAPTTAPSSISRNARWRCRVEAPVILVGVSRGAGLSVAAAGQQSMHGRLKGVVAVGLTKEEEYVDLSDLYGHLPSLGRLPLAVVQSTHDNYLPAAQARALFGADNEHRQFRAIPARNHNFSDAREAMYQAIRASLTWINECP